MPTGEKPTTIGRGDSALKGAGNAFEAGNGFTIFFDEAKGAITATRQKLVGFAEVSYRGGFFAERIRPLPFLRGKSIPDFDEVVRAGGDEGVAIRLPGQPENMVGVAFEDT